VERADPAGRAVGEGAGVRYGLDANPIFRTRGGIGHYAARIADRMSALSPGDEFFLYCWGVDALPDDPWLTRGNVVVRRTPKSSFSAAVRADGVDVFHGTNFRLRARGRRGSVVSIHDLAVRIFPELRRRWVGDWIGHWKSARDAGRADRVIAISERTADDIVRYMGVPREKIRVTLLAAGEEFLPDKDEGKIRGLLARMGMTRPRYILFASTLEPRKNVRTLLEAYLSLRPRFPDLGLVLAGRPGWKSEKTEEFIRDHGLSADVRITGGLSAGDLALLYSHAAVFVLPSLYEGFGMPPVEAMACGAPVIVSDGGSLPEVVGDAAIVVPHDDADRFRREIDRVLTSPALAAELREKGFRRAACFSWDRVAAETLAVYREVTG